MILVYALVLLPRFTFTLPIRVMPGFIMGGSEQGHFQDYLNGGTEVDQDIDSQLNSFALSFVCEK